MRFFVCVLESSRQTPKKKGAECETWWLSGKSLGLRYGRLWVQVRKKEKRGREERKKKKRRRRKCEDLMPECKS